MENGRWLQAVLIPVLLLLQTCAVLTDVVSSLTLHSMENGRWLQAVGFEFYCHSRLVLCLLSEFALIPEARDLS
jgi:hypothetical protein